MAATALDSDLRDEVLERLGFDGPPQVSAGGLAGLYRAWSDRVPFDNLRKLEALAAGGSDPLPGLEANDFFRAWLDHGTGGTCWPSNNGVYSLVRACGFEAERWAASMMDVDVVNHGTTIVRVDGTRWLVDSSMLLGEPLRLDESGTTTTSDDGYRATAEPPADGKSWLIRFDIADGNQLPCRILHGPVADDAVAERYEWSRENSVFNADLYALRRQGADDVSTTWVFGALVTDLKKNGERDAGELSSGDLRRRLTDLGYSPTAIDGAARRAASLA